jgi:hypothetical protein
LELRRIRRWIVLFVIGLVLSGVTAIPLEQEVKFLAYDLVGTGPHSIPAMQLLSDWLVRIHQALQHTQTHHPMLFYGTDWLAFGHLMIALAYLGVWRDPVRNIWLLHFGLWACALVLPWAFVFGHIRGIPFWWRLVDCSFGIIGAIPLWIALQSTRRLEKLTASV